MLLQSRGRKKGEEEEAHHCLHLGAADRMLKDDTMLLLQCVGMNKK